MMGGERAEIAVEPAVSALAEESLRGSERDGSAEDGRIILSVPISEDSELAAWVLRFGPDAEVLSPDRLRSEVARRLEQLSKAYA